MTLIEIDGDVFVAEEVAAVCCYNDVTATPTDLRDDNHVGCGWTLCIYVRGIDDTFDYYFHDEAQTRAAQQKFVNELARA